MVRAEGQEAEGSCERKLPSNPIGDDGHVEYIQGVRKDAQSEGEEIHGTGNEVQETSFSAKRSTTESYYRHIHRHRKIHTVS